MAMSIRVSVDIIRRVRKISVVCIGCSSQSLDMLWIIE